MNRIDWRLAAAAALLTIGLLMPVSPASAQRHDPLVDVRVLTPNRVVEDGRSFVIPRGQSRMRTTPGTSCLGASGSGERVTFPWRTALGSLRVAATARKALRPIRLADDQGFGPGICAIGGIDGPGVPGEPYWGVNLNNLPTDVGADQAGVGNGDELLFYLTPDTFPDPGPSVLRLDAPVRTRPGGVAVTVRAFACSFDNVTFESTCGATPAAGAWVRGGGERVQTGADGKARIPVERGGVTLLASRGIDAQSAPVEVCVRGKLNRCPRARGKTIIGTAGADRIRGTRGNDVIRARGGNDVIDVRAGGRNRIHCGGGRNNRVIAKRGQRLELKRCQRVIRR